MKVSRTDRFTVHLDSECTAVACYSEQFTDAIMFNLPNQHSDLTSARYALLCKHQPIAE